MALPDGMTSCAMCVQFSTNGAAWYDASDALSVVEPFEATRMSGEAYVFGEDTAETGVGKREPVEVKVRGVYAEGTTTVYPAYEAYKAFTTTCGGLLAVRWAPAGCTTAHEVWSTQTTDSEVVAFSPPVGDAGSADIIMFDFTVRTSAVTRAAWS